MEMAPSLPSPDLHPSNTLTPPPHGSRSKEAEFAFPLQSLPLPPEGSPPQGGLGLQSSALPAGEVHAPVSTVTCTPTWPPSPSPLYLWRVPAPTSLTMLSFEVPVGVREALEPSTWTPPHSPQGAGGVSRQPRSGSAEGRGGADFELAFPTQKGGCLGLI